MSFEAESGRLRKRASEGFRGYPNGIALFHGPDDKLATVAVVDVLFEAGGMTQQLRRWDDGTGSLLRDHKVHAEILEHLEAYGVRTIYMLSEVCGCPHEVGLDDVAQESCPHCPYWAGRERPLGW